MNQYQEISTRETFIINKNIRFDWYIDLEVLDCPISNTFILESKWKYGLKVIMKTEGDSIFFGIKAQPNITPVGLITGRFVVKTNDPQQINTKSYRNICWRKIEGYEWYEFITYRKDLKGDQYNHNGRLLVVFEVDLKLFEEERTEAVVTSSATTTQTTRYSHLLETGKYADIKFKVKDKEFNCHRNILASGCDYFEAMFSEKFKESGQPVIEIHDIEPKVFQNILDFIYTSQIPNNFVDNVEELLIAADRYGLEELTRYCELHLASQISLDNFVECLIISESCSRTSLKFKVINFIENNLKDVLKCESWKEFVNKNITVAYQILKTINSSS